MKHLTTIVPAQDRRENTPLSGPWQQIMGGLLMTCKICFFLVKSMDNLKLFLSKVYFLDFPLFIDYLFVNFGKVFVIFDMLAQNLAIFFL